MHDAIDIINSCISQLELFSRYIKNYKYILKYHQSDRVIKISNSRNE